MHDAEAYYKIEIDDFQTMNADRVPSLFRTDSLMFNDCILFYDSQTRNGVDVLCNECKMKKPFALECKSQTCYRNLETFLKKFRDQLIQYRETIVK